ncbi:CPBP family intramembrane glutamic endopeptidase [Nocardioides sp.]|uniref:CPBP family intramembrane glutamic endopeptidase n=1 Tax=Nocardioides sp. TaxID=35761 RepID=UPI0027351D53|nr:CPBP family intramembrane glutamic endopeptidase [Nocardioides sp.]MDP3894451.1 CPBP family intramembrane metalloprotease [Nocardioides sp.]
MDRRRATAAVVTAVVGAVLLGLSLRAEPGSAGFYAGTIALAAVWAGGALASGPLHLGRTREKRPVLPALLVGGSLSGVFIVGGLVVREIPWLAERVVDVMTYAVVGSGPLVVAVTLVNGVAEEMYFRGALYDAVPRHPVLFTTVAYTVATLVTGNPLLAFAAFLLGLVVGQQRRISGGLLAPAITHVTWSLTMLFALPALFGL